MAAHPAAAEIGIGDLQAVVAEIPADSEPRGDVRVAFGLCHRLGRHAAACRALPAGQGPVQPLGIGVAQAMGVAEAGGPGTGLVDLEKPDIAHSRWNQRAVAERPVQLVQQLALDGVHDGDFPAAAVLAPARLEHDAVAVVGERRPELQCFLAAQAEGRLQAQGEGDARFVQPGEGGRRQGAGAAALVGCPFGQAEAGVVARQQAGLADPVGPPAAPAEPVADGGVGDAVRLPGLDQGLDMAGLEVAGVLQVKAETVQIIGHGEQPAVSVGLGRAASVAVMRREPLEGILQAVHSWVVPIDEC